MSTEYFQRGDRIIFTKTKFGPHPGPRAEDIDPSLHGETYSYLVKKFWTVLDREENRLLVQTRTGKQLWIEMNDPGLRAPTWWEQIKYRERFPVIDDDDQPPKKAVNQN